MIEAAHTVTGVLAGVSREYKYTGSVDETDSYVMTRICRYYWVVCDIGRGVNAEVVLTEE